MTINTFTVYKKKSEANSDEIYACNTLINTCFTENRFDDYKEILICYHIGEIIGFVGIYDNLLNQLCVLKEHRNKGVATQILNVSKKVLPSPFYLFIDKNKEKTEYLFNFYLSHGFRIYLQNDIEYKMVFDNRLRIKNIFLLVFDFVMNISKRIHKYFC